MSINNRTWTSRWAEDLSCTSFFSPSRSLFCSEAMSSYLTTVSSDIITSSEYNSLPEKHIAYSAACSKSEERELLDALIAAYGLEERFSVQVIHKQQPDVPADRVVVHEALPNGDALCYTQRRLAIHRLRGLSFRVLPDGRLGAYEFTAGNPQDLSSILGFLTAFVQLATDMAVDGLFGLALDKSPNLEGSPTITGLVKFGFLDIYCPWPPNLAGLPDYDDWACCISARRRKT